MSYSSSLCAQLERKAWGRTDFNAPATLFAGAFIGASEQTSNGWARITISNNTTTFPPNSPLVSGIDLIWPIISVPATGIDLIVFYDSLTGGSEFGRSNTFSSPVNVSANGRLRILAGQLTVSVPQT